MILNALPFFPRKWLQLGQSENWKKLKHALFKHSEHLFLSSVSLQKCFLRRFFPSNFDLNRFEHFASLSRKTVSTSSIKNLQETEKWAFQILTTFFFRLKVAPKWSSKKSFMSKFDLNRFEHFASFFWKTVSTSSLTILEKNWKMLFLNGQNIRFWPQGCY